MTERLSTILLTGAPGVGKTTLVRKICEDLQSSGNIKCNGFYTEEVRREGARIGFDVVTLTGRRGILSRESPTDMLRRPKIGKYSVFITDFEALAIPLLCSQPNDQLLVIDEIGKMELISKKFEETLSNYIGKSFILATIPLQTRQPIPIVERLKTAKDSKLFEITKTNRNHILKEIMQHINKMLSK